ncbi:MAG: hypothetical protein HYS38_08095 [Acidobacteria bacterium]|nr:hypothetical protein [Acidobacteriota bacterium]
MAAEHLAIGITALGRANYAQEAYYGQAFFALTVGLERSAKLAFVIDYALQHNGKFPPNKDVRDYAHDLKALLRATDAIAERNGLSSSEERLPQSPIHDAIIEILSEFARNGTRYYNLDFVTGASSSVNKINPLQQWWERVVTPILDRHYKPSYRTRDERRASLIDDLLAGHAIVRHHTEAGQPLESVHDASQRTGATNFAAPYVRMYVMQIVRFIAALLSQLGRLAQAQQLEDIPYLAEFFVIFNNSDQYFKRRKSWSIYRP